MNFVKSKLKKLSFLIPLFFVLVLYVIGCTRIDPDFGYRLKNGELISTLGFDFFSITDPYSYTMPSYKFVEHAWGLAYVIYLIYSNFGMVGLSALWSVVTCVSIHISLRTSESCFSKRIPFGNFYNFLTIFLATSLLSFFAVRVQVFSWLFISLFLFLYFNKKIWESVRYLIPLIFFLWANLHESFLAGILTFAFLTIIKSLSLEFPREISIKSLLKVLFSIKLKPAKVDISILIVSLLATLINPYGLGVWEHSLREVAVGKMRWKIQEWVPTPLTIKLSDGLYLAISLSAVIRERFKLGSDKLYLYFAYLIQGLLTTRHFPLYLFVSLPITLDALSHFYYEVENVKYGKKRLFASIKFLNIFSVIVLIFSVLIKSGLFSKSDTVSFYPIEAVEYIRKNIPEGEIFSLYGWGGYLNWKLPEKKVFINGFMPVWSRDDAPENESLDVFREYVDLLEEKNDYSSVFEKYDVEIVLMPKEKELNGIDRLSGKIINIFKFSLREEKKTLLKRLRDDGWAEMYSDQTAVILKKPEG